MGLAKYVVFHILSGDILDTINHPNQERYPGQLVHIVAIENYVYLVPFVESEEECTDLRGLQKRALSEGIPYQTLVASILHKYVEGRLHENDS